MMGIDNERVETGEGLGASWEGDFGVGELG